MKTPEEVADGFIDLYNWPSTELLTFSATTLADLLIAAIVTDREQRAELTSHDGFRVGDVVILTGEDWYRYGVEGLETVITRIDEDGDAETDTDAQFSIYKNEHEDCSATLKERKE